jgi:hypothetical protein
MTRGDEQAILAQKRSANPLRVFVRIGQQSGPARSGREQAIRLQDRSSSPSTWAGIRWARFVACKVLCSFRETDFSSFEIVRILPAGQDRSKSFSKEFFCLCCGVFHQTRHENEGCRPHPLHFRLFEPPEQLGVAAAPRPRPIRKVYSCRSQGLFGSLAAQLSVTKAVVLVREGLSHRRWLRPFHVGWHGSVSEVVFALPGPHA